MLEMHMLKHIQTLLSGLHADIRALDRDDEHEVHAAIGLHISEFENMSEGVVVTYRQWALILTRQPRAVCTVQLPSQALKIFSSWRVH